MIRVKNLKKIKEMTKPFALLAFCLMLTLLSRAQNYNTKSTLPGAKTTATLLKEKKKSGVENVIIVYKTHFDIGYSETVQQVLHDYRTSMCDKVLDAIDKNSSQPKDKQFVWTISGWPMKQILWEGQSPERKQKIEQAIRDGNLAIHAFPFTMHTETSDPEDLVRGLNISSTLARKYGQPLSTSAKMSDVPGHSWIIPTLFTHAGIKFYHMGGPVVNMELGLPPIFWWEGPDGSRLLTLYNNGYGSDPLPPAGWPYKTWVYINMTGDNQGPPNPETVAKNLEFYKSRGIKAKVGKMDDFAEMVMTEDLSKLPVIRTDIGDVWIHGTMSMPEASKLAQNIRPSIGGLDELSTLETIWGIYRPDLRKTIADAYEQSLLYSEHTWGLANQHYLKVPYGKAWQELWEQGLPPQYKLLEESWKDHAGYINNAQKLVTNPYRDAVASLADNVAVGENRIVVYNPLPWKRDGVVELDTRLIFGNDFVSLKPVDGGPAIAVSHEYPAIEDKSPMSRFVVKDIPAMGYRTFVASDEKVVTPELITNKESGVIESPFFKATFDAKRGRIVSLVDKRSGKEMVDANAPQGFGQYFYERFGYKQIYDWIAKSLYPQYEAHKFSFTSYDMPQDVDYSSALPENMTLSLEKSAIDVKAVMTGTISSHGQPQKISISLTLSGFNPTADLEVSWQKQPDTWPEAAWICLPFKCDNPKFRLGRLGADADPVKDMVTDNSNHHLWWVNNGVTVYDGKSGAGFGISSPDAPLVSLGEPGEYKFDKHFEPQKPYVYLNLFNNHWRTNFPAWIGNGQRMSARVRLWAFDKYATESALYTPAMETRVPMQVACSRVKNGKLPVAQQGISLSRKGVALTAFGPNPDGEGIILRLWEQGGTTGKIEVTLPDGATFTSAQPVNLRGEKNGEPLLITDGKLSFDLRAYAPASFILK
jgi:alpha-mannosidase